VSGSILLTQDYPPRPGGMARYYAALAAGLGPECRVLCGGWEGARPVPSGTERVLALSFDAAHAHRFWNLRRAVRAVEREICEAAPAVLLVGNVRPYGPAAAALARRRGVPAVQIYHGNDLLRTARRWSRHPWKRRRWRQVVESARLHVVNSRFTAAEAARLGLPPERIAVVPPEVDETRFRPPRSPEERAGDRRRFGFAGDAPVSLFLGRPVARKGVDLLLDALAGLETDTTVAFAGAGDWEPWRARAARNGLSGRVRFLGKVDEAVLPALYRAADLFLAPSRARPERDDVEGFGIVFLEAACSGLPVLAARTGGVPEAVEDGTGGVLVEPGDAEALGRAWRDLLGNPQTRRRMGERGRRDRAAENGRGSSARRLRRALAGAGIRGA